MTCKYLLMILTTGLLSGMAFAKSTFDDSVMMPGSRLVAGDLTRNEFFILGKDEREPRIQPAFQPEATKPVENRSVPKIKMAIKEALHQPKRERLKPEVKTAFQKEVFKPIVKEYHQVFAKTAVKKKGISGSATKKVAVSHTHYFGKKPKTIKLAAATAKTASYKTLKVKTKPKVKSVMKGSQRRAVASNKKSATKPFVKSSITQI